MQIWYANNYIDTFSPFKVLLADSYTANYKSFNRDSYYLHRPFFSYYLSLTVYAEPILSYKEFVIISDILLALHSTTLPFEKNI